MCKVTSVNKAANISIFIWEYSHFNETNFLEANSQPPTYTLIDLSGSEALQGLANKPYVQNQDTDEWSIRKNIV